MDLWRLFLCLCANTLLLWLCPDVLAFGKPLSCIRASVGPTVRVLGASVLFITPFPPILQASL